eukprot:gene26134-biopygen14253
MFLLCYGLRMSRYADYFFLSSLATKGFLRTPRNKWGCPNTAAEFKP